MSLFNIKESILSGFEIPVFPYIPASTGFSKKVLERALEKGEFEVYYQPILNPKTEEILSWEALLRWNHPKLGVISPKRFITPAEETGVIFSLGEYVLRTACIQSSLWKKEGLFSPKIAVNVSMVELADRDFAEKVFCVLREEGVSVEQISLEIIESLAMIDPETTREILSDLRDGGMQVFLDDFGSGYSSLNHIRQFPLYGIKIDGQFVQHCERSEKDLNLLRSIALLTDALELVVIAEGVENEEQFNLLKDMECYGVQGFYFTPPLLASKCTEWFNQRSTD